MADTSSNCSGCIVICYTAFIVFLTLKFVGTIGWSWWWVTAPLWMPAGIGVVVFGIIFLFDFFT